MSTAWSARRYIVSAVLTGVLCVGGGVVWLNAAWAGDNSGHELGKPRYNAQGELLRPDGWREWVFVGAPVTPNDMNDGAAPFPEFHNVYINPWAYSHYKKTGQFPEGTVLVKETVSVGAKEAASGNGYFQGEPLGLEVAVKDSKQFPDEPGQWAYFSFGKHPDLAPAAKAHATSSCNTCHNANAQQDWVFTQYYPVLRAAKP